MPLLDWLNKPESLHAAGRVPYRLLEGAPDLSYGDAANPNLLIQGDNLEALKALLPLYGGQVKCIYIDPPYNTRSAFEHYDDNLEHSQWLSMMYPRLELLRDLLAEDGSIWVSIDDNEAHYLKVILDEIFGRKNFYCSFIWQKVDSPNDNKVPVTPDHEYILCYHKKIDAATFKKKSDRSLLDSYRSTQEEPRLHRDRLLKKNGKNSLREDRPTMFFGLDDPDGTIIYPMHDDGREACWAMGRKSITTARTEGRLIWKQRKKNGVLVWIPYTREFAPENPTRPHPTILLDVNTTRQAKAHQKTLFSSTIDTIKPEELIARILEIATNEGDLVLDSFLGSGTTAAVAHKMNRPYIGIEMGDHATTHCQPRLKQVIDGEQGGISKQHNWQGGGGFHFYHLGNTVFDTYGMIDPSIRFPTLAAYIWYLETRTPWQLSGQAPETLTPLLGIHDDTAYYLLYNGILGDRRPQGGNVLTQKVLDALPHFDGKKVIYGETTRFGESRLALESISFKQIPYDVKAML